MIPDTLPGWKEAARRITAPGIRRVLVLGPADSGKSTLCRLLLRTASERDPALLDADPAQKLVGPPACVTLGRLGTDGSLTLSALAFVGALDPLRSWRRLVAGTELLASEARAGLLLANTSGLLRGAGRRLKAAKIAAVRPDLLIAVGDHPGLEAVPADHAAIPALRLPRSPLARRKAEGERRALRRDAFRRYFAATPVWPLSPEGIRLEGEPNGSVLPEPRQLVALIDAAGWDLVLGIVLGRDAQGRLLLRAPMPEAPVAGLRWGKLWLDESLAPMSAVTPRPAPSPRR